MAPKILIVDDEPDMVRLLETALEDEAYELACAYDGREGLRQAYAFQPDLVLLDVMMPHMNGWETLTRLREFTDVPVIMLTALDAIDNVVKGLEQGADDYVTKPFRIQELTARIRSTLRRAAMVPSAEERRLSFDGGQLAIDPNAHRVTVRGSTVELTPTEYKLLFYLASNAGQTLTCDQILYHVWGPEAEVSSNRIKVFVRNLRRKIEADPGRPRYILTQRGTGYYLEKM